MQGHTILTEIEVHSHAVLSETKVQSHAVLTEIEVHNCAVLTETEVHIHAVLTLGQCRSSAVTVWDFCDVIRTAPQSCNVNLLLPCDAGKHALTNLSTYDTTHNMQK